MESMADRIKELRRKNKMTLEEMGAILGIGRSGALKYEQGKVKNIKRSAIMNLAAAFGVSPSYHLFGEDEATPAPNVLPIKKKRFPLLGKIACGEPIFADEERESYVDAGTEINADFCLKCTGDSMIGARILNGDIVFIRRQDMVENGEIAAVVIDDEATLKRVFYDPEKGKMVLQAENPRFQPLVYVGDELNEIRILGKAVAFQSDVR